MTEQTSTVTCKYPGCEAPPERAAGPGRPPEYCADPGHNKVAAWRERRRLADAERGAVTTDADVEAPVTQARVTGAEMLRQMRDLAGTLAGVADRLTGTVATLGDPTAAEIEADAIRAAAEQRAATAESARAEAERRAVAADQMRSDADGAAEEMSEHLAAEQARARDAHNRLTEAIDAHAAELERVRSEAQARIGEAIAERDAAVAQAEADKTAAIAAADERADRAAAEARQAIERARADADALVRSAEADRDQARELATQHQEATRAAEQRAAAAEARADATRADADRAHEEAGRMLDQVRSDATRERDELREAMQARVQAAEAELARRDREYAAELGRVQAAADARAAVLEESRADLRARAERAERELDQARDELTQLRQDPGSGEAEQAATRQPRRRRGQASEGT